MSDTTSEVVGRIEPIPLPKPVKTRTHNIRSLDEIPRMGAFVGAMTSGCFWTVATGAENRFAIDSNSDMASMTAQEVVHLWAQSAGVTLDPNGDLTHTFTMTHTILYISETDEGIVHDVYNLEEPRVEIYTSPR